MPTSTWASWALAGPTGSKPATRPSARTRRGAGPFTSLGLCWLRRGRADGDRTLKGLRAAGVADAGIHRGRRAGSGHGWPGLDVDPGQDADDRHRPDRAGDQPQQAVGLGRGQLGEDVLADDVAEQEQEDPERQAADPGDLADGLEELRVHRVPALVVGRP